jgi:hypothetical protein
MTEGLMPAEVLARLQPEAVTPGLLFLASDEAPTRTILCAGAGTFERAHITLTEGVHIGAAREDGEAVSAQFEAISNRAGEQVPGSGSAQGANEVTKAVAASTLK